MSDFQTMKAPKYAPWVVKLTPDGRVTHQPSEGGAPCWFHRQMHYLFFGFKWERIK